MAQETFTMTPKELSRYETIKRLIKKEINGTEAAKQMNLSVRQVKNIKAKVKKYGLKGVIHGSRGKSGNRKMQQEKIEGIEKIVKTKYSDFGPFFASEKLEEIHHIKISNEKLRLLMTEWGLWQPKPKKKNKEYRSWRQRREQYGEMQQFDGSYHKWFEDRGPECCLLASIDDATGKITGLKFVHWETVMSVFAFWKEYVGTYGKPVSIYLDRHSTYKQNQKSVLDDPKCLTQFQRAMKDLGIDVIHAYSPQAKGRAERLFKTLQDRLVKELRLANISTPEEGNEFAKKTFIPQFNAKFAVVPQKKGNLHKALTKFEKDNLARIFSSQNTRVVNNDFTISFNKQWFQLASTQPTTILRKDKVQVEERIDGKIFISLRNKYLNYEILPERPKKVKMKVVALTRTKPSWKPPADHPWRQPFILDPKRYQTSGVSQKTF